MSKPEDIPQDVWDRAERHFDDFLRCPSETFRPAVQTIARAIMAAKAEEREACAKIIDANAFGNQAIIRAMVVAAHAIRKRGEG